MTLEIEEFLRIVVTYILPVAAIIISYLSVRYVRPKVRAETAEIYQKIASQAATEALQLQDQVILLKNAQNTIQNQNEKQSQW